MTTLDISEHLKSRHVDMNVHTVWLNYDEITAVFPLWDLSGRMVGYQTYRPLYDKHKDNHPKESRYYTYKTEQCNAVWGLESWKFSNTLFVTEGVFNAARLTYNGVSAVALLSNSPSKSLMGWLRIIQRTRPVVAVCDNDSAGKKLAKAGNIAVITESADLGDATEDEVKHIIKQYSTNK